MARIASKLSTMVGEVVWKEAICPKILRDEIRHLWRAFLTLINYSYDINLVPHLVQLKPDLIPT